MQLEIEWKRTTEVLERYAEVFIQEARNKLRANESLATQDLYNNIRPLIQIGDDEVSVSLYLEDYYIYLEKGRKAGKMPPFPKIRDWVKVKKIASGDNIDNVAWAITKSIGKNGTKPHPFLKPTKEEVNPQFENELMYAVQEDIAAYIENVLVYYYEILKGL